MTTLSDLIAPYALSASANVKPSQSWRPLYLFNLYRLTSAGLFLAVISLGTGPDLLGKHNPVLFFLVSLLYVAISVLNSFTIRWRTPSFVLQVYFLILFDIAAIITLMHASGSIQSGLGILLIVTIAGGSLLIARRSAILLAAIATIMLLLEQTYIVVYNEPMDVSYTQSGLLGAILFATATVSQFLARRIRESEMLAAQRSVDLANMEQLTEYVIQRMQTGIIVIDGEEKVRLMNESAWQLISTPPSDKQRSLIELSPELAGQVYEWQKGGGHSRIFKPAGASGNVLPRFARLGNDSSSGTLIFLEDTAAMAQQAQQLKLASLGRLTASIAHEIRNPLGAISHAGQLLAESSHLDQSETRMTQIILDNSSRMNRIVENVLQLSRRKRSAPEDIALKTWLHTFVSDYCRTQQVAESLIRVTVIPADVRIRFDTSQLHQVLWNLCQNALRYSQADEDGAALKLIGGVAIDAPTPFLDVVDFGHGIDPKLTEQIFEPFFTTDSKGTGLGLYIARELCESNQARLNYRSNEQGSRFRITFADARRAQDF